MRFSYVSKVVGVATCVLVLAGCAVVSTHEEYAAYRAVRRAESDRDRLIAAQQYVAQHPGGHFIEEVQALRSAQEESVWEASNATREGLEWYLQVYPDGQYVEQARPRLAALQAVSAGREQEAQAQLEFIRQQQQQAEEARRTWVTRAMQFWTRTLLGVRNYGSSIQRVVAANQEFSRAFGQNPAPQCTAEYCIKHYGQLYHIPVRGGTRIDRRIDVYLRLSFVRGRMERVELILPNKGFSRWYEMENRAVVTDEDPEMRTTALNWALERIQPIVEEVAQGATRIDFAPERVPPLQIHGRSTEAAPTSPDETPAPAEAPRQKQDDLESLLNAAAGVPEEEPAETPPEPPPPPEPVAPTPTEVRPTGLLAWRYEDLRVVIFAASPDDHQEGYDGIFIERVREEAPQQR